MENKTLADQMYSLSMEKVTKEAVQEKLADMLLHIKNWAEQGNLTDPYTGLRLDNALDKAVSQELRKLGFVVCSQNRNDGLQYALVTWF